MLYEVQLNNFQGPLDLLLSLIEKDKLDITDISLSKVTDDYLEYLQNNDIESEQINWFLEIAAKLIFIKSQVLLPVIDDNLEDEDSNIDLAKQLEVYRIFKEAALNLKALSSEPMITRKHSLSFLKNNKPKNLNKEKLLLAIHNISKSHMERSQPIQFKLKKANTYTYLKKLKAILKQNPTKLSSLLEVAKDREEKIMYFLACLELIKKSEIIFKKNQREFILEKIL